MQAKPPKKRSERDRTQDRPELWRGEPELWLKQPELWIKRPELWITGKSPGFRP